MRYTIPDYYNQFCCLAGSCPQTCCAGWQIMIDEKTKKAYRTYPGRFGSRLANSIDWKEGKFLQYDRRCVFLNEENLCDIHLEAGEELMCHTCRTYPKHIEVYENEREISLSLSCPEVARLILGKKDPVRFCTVERGRTEQEEDFDDLLYSALQDSRAVMIAIAQDRSCSLRMRMAKLLALAHDIQNRIDTRRLFEVEEVLTRYRRAGADACLEQKLEAFTSEYLTQMPERDIGVRDTWKMREIRRAEEAENTGCKQKTAAACLEELLSLKWRQLDYLRDFEVLDSAWAEDLQRWRRALYGDGCQKYLERDWSFRRLLSDWETEYEQILVYFLFTYFCGAVYDGDALRKVQMAVTSILILQELALAEWICQDGALTLEDRARLAWRYSRELEHSDPNLVALEGMMGEWKEAQFHSLLVLLLRG